MSSVDHTVPTRHLELRAGEGGADARRFVVDLAQAYLNMAARFG